MDSRQGTPPVPEPADVAGRLAAAVERWGLELGPQYQRSFNYVYRATTPDGESVVVKLATEAATGAEFTLAHEAELLRRLGARGATVRLLGHAPELGAVLMERADPGETLVELSLADDVAATDIAAAVMRRFSVSFSPAPTPTPSTSTSTDSVDGDAALSARGTLDTVGSPGTVGSLDTAGAPSTSTDTGTGAGTDDSPIDGINTVAEHATDFAAYREREQGSGPLDPRVFERGDRVFHELLASSAPAVVLHGDLHHLNILSGRRGWLAIDPKGLLGEPAYEAGALLRNPFPQLLSVDDPRRVLRRRVHQLAESLGLDRERVRLWGFAQAVLAGVWAVEDRTEGVRFWMACADLLGDG